MNVTETIKPGVLYYLNPVTKKMELTDKTVDYDAVMKTAQEQLEELKKKPVGNNTLTDAEIQELAQKYDPQNMTQKEYDDFIYYLEKKGVLSKLETCDIGVSFTRIIPGYNGLTVSMGTASTKWIKTLADTKGNVLQFAQAKSQVQGLGYNGQIQQGAYSKVLDILNQMNVARGEMESSRTCSAYEKDIWSGSSTNENDLPASALIGDLSGFQLMIDRVKSESIQIV